MITIVLICGSSGSGKSTLAQKVAESLLVSNDPTTTTTTEVPSSSTTKVHVIPQDDFFTTPFVPYHQRHDWSYEDGSSIDWEQLTFKMKECIKSSSSSRTTKNTLNNNNNNDNKKNKNKNIILIVEGHMLGAGTSQFFQFFSDQQQDNEEVQMIVIFLKCSKESCKERRLNRKQHRHRQQRSIDEWNELSIYFDQYVWPCFINVGIPTMESLRTYATTSSTTTTITNNNVTILDLSTESSQSLDTNVKTIIDSIHQQTSGSQIQQDKKNENVKVQQQEEIIETWPSLEGNWNGFAHHDIVSIRLDHYDSSQSCFELECVSSLSLLDMVHLSHGSHDATGHSIWMGAFLLIEALSANVTFPSTTTTTGSNQSVSPLSVSSSSTSSTSLRSLFHSQTVLELGCGTGVGGLSLLLSPNSWNCRPIHVSFSDNDQNVLELCQTNCNRYWPVSSSSALKNNKNNNKNNNNENNTNVSFLTSSSTSSSSTNELQPIFSTFILHWGDGLPKPKPPPPALKEGGDDGGEGEEGEIKYFNSYYDTILATDVLYDLACLRPLLSTVYQCLGEDGFFILAHVPRSCLPEDETFNSSETITENEDPPNNNNNNNEKEKEKKRDYHTILEDHIQMTAMEFGLQTCTIIRPEQIIQQQQQQHHRHGYTTTKTTTTIKKNNDEELSFPTTTPLNLISLTEMEEAGASLFVFQKQPSK